MLSVEAPGDRICSPNRLKCVTAWRPRSCPGWQLIAGARGSIGGATATPPPFSSRKPFAQSALAAKGKQAGTGRAAILIQAVDGYAPEQASTNDPPQELCKHRVERSKRFGSLKPSTFDTIGATIG
jgi:hypothetical protein